MGVSLWVVVWRRGVAGERWTPSMVVWRRWVANEVPEAEEFRRSARLLIVC